MFPVYMHGRNLSTLCLYEECIAFKVHFVTTLCIIKKARPDIVLAAHSATLKVGLQTRYGHLRQQAEKHGTETYAVIKRLCTKFKSTQQRLSGVMSQH